MAYITLANSRRIIHQTELKWLNLKGPVYKSPTDFLNKLEINRMLAVKELFSDPENFFTQYYKPIKTKDTFTYVYEGKKPAYHDSITCERLNSDFENFKIPDSIFEAGKTKIEEFRQWFKENQHLLEKPEVFEMRLKLKWNIETNLENIHKPNGGTTLFNDFTADDYEKQIDEILNLANDLTRQHPLILNKYGKSSYLGKSNAPLVENNTGYSDEAVKKILFEFEQSVKKPLMPLLVNYYRLTLNPELNLHESALQQLGFVPCSYCCSKKEKQLNNISSHVPFNDNLNITFKLLQERKDLSSIAQIRGYTPETIIKHIQQIAELNGINELEHIKPKLDTINRVKTAIDTLGERDKIRPIYDVLNEEISYTDIRLSLIFIN